MTKFGKIVSFVPGMHRMSIRTVNRCARGVLMSILVTKLHITEVYVFIVQPAGVTRPIMVSSEI
jgi:hypothetical protein